VVFGRLSTIKVIRLGPEHPDSCPPCFWYREHHLASGFGLIYIWEEPGDVAFLLGCVIAGDTFGTVVSVLENDKTVPQKFHLAQNYPNPFNPTTTIEFSLPQASFVRLNVYDLLGREIAVLIDDRRRAGRYSLTFDGSNLPSGLYIVRLQTEAITFVKKMILMK